MGGCSSKPKTAEFAEAAMVTQEDMLQDDAATKRENADTIGVDYILKVIDEEEEERNDVRDVTTETDKSFIEAPGAEANVKIDRQKSGDCYTSVKELIEEEISDAFFSGRKAVAKEANLNFEKGSKIWTPESFQLDKDRPFIDVSITAPQEKPFVSANGANAVNPQKEPSVVVDGTGEVQLQPIVGHENTTARNLNSHDEGHCHLDACSLQDEVMKSGKDILVEAGRTLMVQEFTPEGRDMKLQTDFFEEARKKTIALKSQETDHENEGWTTLVAIPRQVDVVKLESQEMPMPNEAKKNWVGFGPEEVVHGNGGLQLDDGPAQTKKIRETLNGTCIAGNHTEENGIYDLGNGSLPMKDDQSPKDVTMANSAIEQKGLLSSVGYRYSRHGHIVHEKGMQAMAVDVEASILAKKFEKRQPEAVSKDLWHVAGGDLQQEVDVDKHHLPPVASEECIDRESSQNADDIPQVMSRAAIVCNKEIVSNADPRVIVVMKENSTARPMNGVHPIRLAFREIPAQEVTARDMDDVLEKLAWEFERQESLACSTL